MYFISFIKNISKKVFREIDTKHTYNNFAHPLNLKNREKRILSLPYTIKVNVCKSTCIQILIFKTCIEICMKTLARLNFYYLNISKLEWKLASSKSRFRINDVVIVDPTKKFYQIVMTFWSIILDRYVCINQYSILDYLIGKTLNTQHNHIKICGQCTEFFHFFF